MAGKLIVVNGGSHGGLFTDEHGTRAVPLPAEILRHLEAVRNLLSARGGLGSDSMTAQDLAVLITRVANLAIDRIEAAFGSLEDEDCLIYQDDRGGFICGSAGAAPRSFRWPAATVALSRRRREVARRALTPDAIELARRAVDAGVELQEVFENPMAVADRLKFRLSDRSGRILRLLAPSRLTEISSEVDRELVTFMFRVFDDGRFVETWTTEPSKVAVALGVEISPAVVDRILAVSPLMASIIRSNWGAGDDDSPPPGDDSPPPGDDSPPPGDDSPPPGDDSPPPGDDSPPPGDDSPPPGDDSPPGDDTGPPNISDMVNVNIVSAIIVLIIIIEPNFEEELAVEEAAKF